MRKIVFLTLFLLLIISAFVALRFGSVSIEWQEFWHSFTHPSEQGTAQSIIWLTRFPRVIAAVLVGAGLAAAGCALQGLLRNPLAEPYTLGISGGAALGAAIVTVFVPIAMGAWTRPVSAFLGASVSVFLVYLVAGRRRFSVTGLILAGVILSFIFSSAVLLILTLASPLETNSILFWLIGSLSSADINIIKAIPFFIIPGICILYLFGRDLDAIALGDEKAFHLGVEAIKVRQILFVVTSMIAGACIAAAGMVGFVGLIIPHAMRMIIGPGHKPLIIASSVAGAAFLVLADTVARTVLSRQGQELPVGVVTGIIGGMFFIILLLNQKEKISF